jgi:hypothetical protein
MLSAGDKDKAVARGIPIEQSNGPGVLVLKSSAFWSQYEQ